jgi:hypothetical protein
VTPLSAPLLRRRNYRDLSLILANLCYNSKTLVLYVCFLVQWLCKNFIRGPAAAATAAGSLHKHGNPHRSAFSYMIALMIRPHFGFSG